MIKIFNIIMSALMCSSFVIAMDSTPVQPGKPFIRLASGEEKASLQLGSKTYKDKTGSLKVTLLSAIHFARPEFYKRHNEILNQATFVLYEGKGFDKKGFEWRQKPIVKKHDRLDTYTLVSKAHNLDTQFESVSYQRSNFILADYSFDEVMVNPDRWLNEVGELIEHLNKKYAKEAAESNYSDGFEYYVGLKIKETKTSTPLRYISAQLLEASQNSEEYLQKNSPAEVFEKEYTKRNKIVLEKFAEQKTCFGAQAVTHVVIYYGAGHMPYFEKQFCETYGLELASEEWITAFSY